MPPLARVVAGLILSMALAALPARAQIRIEPIPPGVVPKWTLVPNTPKIYYAPNIPTDVFRYRGQYYFYWGGYLYQGKKATGPWKVVMDVPAWFYQIDPSYFKTAQPGGAPAPPTPGSPPGPEMKGPEEIPETPEVTPPPAPAPEPKGAPPAPQEAPPLVM